MTIRERIKLWISKLAFWRSRPDDGSKSTTAIDPVSGPKAEVGAAIPPVVEEQPPVFLEVGMVYTLEGWPGFERPRVEVWPLQPSETAVRIESGRGAVWPASNIGGYERRSNPQVNATWTNYIAAMPDVVRVVVVNRRVGTIIFPGVETRKFSTHHQRVQMP